MQEVRATKQLIYYDECSQSEPRVEKKKSDMYNNYDMT